MNDKDTSITQEIQRAYKLPPYQAQKKKKSYLLVVGEKQKQKQKKNPRSFLWPGQMISTNAFGLLPSGFWPMLSYSKIITSSQYPHLL